MFRKKARGRLDVTETKYIYRETDVFLKDHRGIKVYLDDSEGNNSDELPCFMMYDGSDGSSSTEKGRNIQKTKGYKKKHKRFYLEAALEIAILLDDEKFPPETSHNYRSWVLEIPIRIVRIR